MYICVYIYIYYIHIYYIHIYICIYHIIYAMSIVPHYMRVRIAVMMHFLHLSSFRSPSQSGFSSPSQQSMSHFGIGNLYETLYSIVLFYIIPPLFCFLSSFICCWRLRTMLCIQQNYLCKRLVRS